MVFTPITAIKKHHIRKSDIKKLMSSLSGGNYNEFSHYCRHLSTGDGILLVIFTLIALPLVMTIAIDAAIETQSWLILAIFAMVGFIGINISIFKKYGGYIELCLNELTSYIGAINFGEKSRGSKRNIIMTQNVEKQSQAKTKANWLFYVGLISIIIGVFLFAWMYLKNAFSSDVNLADTDIMELICALPFFIVGFILFDIHSAVNGEKTNLGKVKDAIMGKIVHKRSKRMGIIINDNIFCFNQSNYIQYIKDICQKYRLYNLVIKTTEGLNAHATIIDNVPHIFVGADLIKQLDDDSILFVIGHEIGHIYYGDLKNKDNHSFVKLTLIILGILLLCVLMIDFFSSQLGFWVAVIIFFLLFYFDRVFYMSYDNEYYCKQIRELRADRFGLNVSKISINDVIEISEILKNINENDEPASVPLFEAILIRLKILPAIEDCHPSWEFRIQEMDKNKSRTKWGLIDDMYYTWKFSIGIMFSHRWRLK